MKWLAFGILAFAALVTAANSTPSIHAVEAAMNLYPGRSMGLNVGGTPVYVTYIGIEPMHGKRYAIIVEVR